MVLWVRVRKVLGGPNLRGWLFHSQSASGMGASVGQPQVCSASGLSWALRAAAQRVEPQTGGPQLELSSGSDERVRDRTTENHRKIGKW